MLARRRREKIDFLRHFYQKYLQFSSDFVFFPIFFSIWVKRFSKSEKKNVVQSSIVIAKLFCEELLYFNILIIRTLHPAWMN